MELFDDPVERIAFADTPQVQRHARCGQTNAMGRGKVQLLTPNEPQGMANSRCGWLCLGCCRLSP